MKWEILQKPKTRIALQIVDIPIVGFLLLNLTFIFDALYQGIIRSLISVFIPFDQDSHIIWLSVVLHFSFVVIICIISKLIFKSKLNHLFKSSFLMVSAATVLVTIGMFSCPNQIIAFLTGTGFVFSVLLCLIKTKQARQYFYALCLITLALVLGSLTGMEI